MPAAGESGRCKRPIECKAASFGVRVPAPREIEQSLTFEGNRVGPPSTLSVHTRTCFCNFAQYQPCHLTAHKNEELAQLQAPCGKNASCPRG